MFRQVFYYFIAVVEERGFSAASKKFYLSQSAISQQIANLEKELNLKLFDRHSYLPVLTKEGEQFYQLCLTLKEQYEKELKHIQFQAHNHSETLIIGITGPFEKKYIPMLANEFKKKHDITLIIKYLELSQCAEELKKQKIDIGFGLVNDFEQISEIQSFNIYQSHVCIVTSRLHPLAQKTCVNIQDIKDEPIVILSKKVGKYCYKDYMKAFQKDGIKPHIVEEVDNLNEFILAIQLNHGIGLSALEVISNQDEVTSIPLLNSHHHADYAIGYNKNTHKKSAKDFTDYVIDYFKDYKLNL